MSRNDFGPCCNYNYNLILHYDVKCFDTNTKTNWNRFQTLQKVFKELSRRHNYIQCSFRYFPLQWNKYSLETNVTQISFSNFKLLLLICSQIINKIVSIFSCLTTFITTWKKIVLKELAEKDSYKLSSYNSVINKAIWKILSSI